MPPSLAAVLDRLRHADLPTFHGVTLDHPNVRGRSFGDTPLHIMATWGDIDTAAVLLDHDAEIDARGEHQFTPLHEAISQGHTEMVRFLLSKGADPGKRCDFGTALDLARISNRPDLIDLLS